MIREEYANMYSLENNYWWYVALHELVEHYVSRAQNHGPLRLFDAGCGTGRLMTILQRHGEIDGVDYSEDAIGFCRERGLRNANQGDLNLWTVPPASYDIVTCIDILCHASIKNDLSIIQRFYDALRPGGFFILNLPAFDCIRRRHDDAVFTVRRYQKNDLREPMEKMGFEIKIMSYRLPFLFGIIGLKKISESLDPDKTLRSDLGRLASFWNRLFLSVARLDNWMIRNRLPVPFGSSLFLVALKPSSP